MNDVRVRIAPSPTGIPHIGNTRTALFNWLFAKHHQGKFIVRIEDTDQARLVPGSEEKILEILKWLGLSWDEGPEVGGDLGPYTQSQRQGLYQQYAQDLIDQKKAAHEDGAVRFLPTQTGETVWQDLVHGEIKIENQVVEPFIILKSDHFPTYHLANVVDDHLMKISHVLRGDEWISSTPKHLMLYEALGWEPPAFGHLPVILGSDKSKLSKRHGAYSALDYRDQGYLPEALLNFMVLLGWNPKTEQEIFSLEELTQVFDLKDINHNSPIFDAQKLDWFNGKYLRNLTDQDYYLKLKPFLPSHYPEDKVKGMIPLVKERIDKLTEFESLTAFVFADQVEVKAEDLQFIDPKFAREILNQYIILLEDSKNWRADIFETKGRDLAQKCGLKVGEVFMLLRVVLAGQRVTPPLFESLVMLGQKPTVDRLKKGLEKI